jgi:hypothetical protein
MRSLLVLLIWIAAACANREEKPKPLVYEGMSGEELEKTLGLPSEKDSLQPIFDGETMERLPVEKWIYEKRTVLLINDTVKNPNVNSNEGG